MWLMLQQDKPDDFVLATGHMHSVREFVEVVVNMNNEHEHHHHHHHIHHCCHIKQHHRIINSDSIIIYGLNTGHIHFVTELVNVFVNSNIIIIFIIIICLHLNYSYEGCLRIYWDGAGVGGKRRHRDCQGEENWNCELSSFAALLAPQGAIVVVTV